MAPNPTEFCRDPHRREDIRVRGQNGIDYIEVSDDRLTLAVYFLRTAPEEIARNNVRIMGGVRIRDIEVVEIRLRPAEESDNDDCLEVLVDKAGDFSIYTLQLIETDEQDRPTNRPLAGFDPRYAQADFTFNVAPTAELDCRQTAVCPPPEWPSPEVNYLAKDYSTFRQVILDRLAVTMPGWREQHVPDLGIVLVEILAYVGDYLSYYQDAVATEAYLDTARQRISIRRHVRLIDYAMHEGCNARTWVHVAVDRDMTLKPKQISFLTASGHEPGPDTADPSTTDANASGPQTVVFEPLISADIHLHQAHNEIKFYTWGDRLCCIAVGATSATLLDSWEDVAPEPPTKDRYEEDHAPNTRSAKSNPVQRAYQPGEPPPRPPTRKRKLRLKPGDVLLFEEVAREYSGLQPDPAHRHFVRLTSVEQGVDPLYDEPVPVVDIRWDPEDALPFALTLSVVGDAPDCAHIPDVTVARGNIVLVDQGNWTGNGSWIYDEDLGTVPCVSVTKSCEGIGRAAQIEIQAGKFRPVMKRAPLTFRQPPSATIAAAGALKQDPSLAVAQIELRSIPPAPDGSAPLFQFADLQNPSALASRLTNPDDKAANLLRNHLSAKTLALLGEMSKSHEMPDRLASGLADELGLLVRQWSPRRDLLGSHGQDLHFVVEMDDAGRAHLRFGDGDLGRAPEAGELFAATYRIGIGLAGNVGRETVNRVLLSRDVPGGATITPRNPIAAAGGTEPESIEKVKLIAPGAFQKELQRAVTAEDYARLAEQDAKVQRAAATLQWAGTHYEVRVAIDPLGTDRADPDLLRKICGKLYRYRRIGHSVVVEPAHYVPLDIIIDVNAAAGFIGGHVKAALLDVFSNRVLPDGRRGFFHPDNLTFGGAIYLSKIVAVAQAVTGVESVKVSRLERLFAGPNREIETGVLAIGPLEIAQLNNDANRPEEGKLRINVRGGR